jgi:hypothetical protein
MSARLLRTSIALLLLLAELRYTLSRLLAHPRTAAFAPTFQGLREQWSAVQALEISFIEQRSDAKAQIDIADAGLDDFATRFSHAVQAVTGQKREDPLYQHFFPKPLNEIQRPVLGGQLKIMQQWLLSLETSPHATLTAMRPELATLVEAAVQATANRDTVALRRRDFRNLGERRQLFDQVNAERKELHGVLTKLALSTPGLPSTFANEFFKPGPSDDGGEDEVEETIESVTAEILALEETLTERRERLAELEEGAADAAQQAEDAARKAARLAELKQEIEARQREAQALADELE